MGGLLAIIAGVAAGGFLMTLKVTPGTAPVAPPAAVSAPAAVLPPAVGAATLRPAVQPVAQQPAAAQACAAQEVPAPAFGQAANACGKPQSVLD